MQFDYVVRNGMKPEYMFRLLIYLVVSRIISIRVKRIPHNLKCNRSTLAICIIDRIPLYPHQRTLRFIVQPNSLQQFLSSYILFLQFKKIRIFIAAT